MDLGLARQSAPPFRNLPSDQRWEDLRPIICDRYLNKDKSLAAMSKFMQETHHFYALEHQYKYHLGNWKISKNLSPDIKEAALVGIRKRIRGTDSHTSPVVSYQGQDIPKKKLRRYISDTEAGKAKKEKDKPLQLSQNIFIHWNLPSRALASSSATPDNASSSPFGPTPTGLSFGSPYFQNNSSSLRNALSPIDAPTPLTVAIKSKAMNDRALLLVQGKNEELLKQLTRTEKRIVTTWLYQFWLFSFKTAKHWGFGPTEWTAELLKFDLYKEIDLPPHTLPSTPRLRSNTSRELHTPNSEVVITDASQELSHEPSSLCRWTIHAAIRSAYERCDTLSEDGDPLDDRDLDDADDWSRWSETANKQSFEEKLQLALENNTFSDLNVSDLPLAAKRIMKATRHSPNELLRESFSFTIVARNEEVFWNLLSRVEKMSFENTGIYPFHLLTNYLDGSKTCCNLLDAALNGLSDRNDIKKLYINNHGHTVLDNLMITILKAHTNCPPWTVDDKFSKLKRFMGEEVDICGRWDADSPCIRDLFASGRSTIPFEWKHMFCHTSVQTICHSIGRLFGPHFAPDINTPSGLFSKSCQHCGKVLGLLPLHTLVLTAYHLARNGCEDENLFGMLACLTCLLANGADPQMKTAISFKALRGIDNAIECTHEELDPFELAQQVPESLMTDTIGDPWSDEKRLGWQVFCALLQYARDERRPLLEQRSSDRVARNDRRQNQSAKELFTEFVSYYSDEESSDYEMSDVDEEWDSESNVEDELCPHSKPNGNFYGRSKVIGKLWAAIQTELLTYRRLAEGDPWLSENFDIHGVLDGLRNGGMIEMPLLDNNMVNEHCPCGRFRDITDEACACVDEVCSYYFANLDDWNRASYIVIPEGFNESWYDFL